MRELKFRAWDGERMFYPNKDCYFAIFEGENTVGWCIYDRNDGRRLLSGEHNAIIMQYTGRKDMNGKEVYEGDIIEYENNNSGYGRPREEEISRDVVPSLLDHNFEWDIWPIYWKDGEVIGNIHEHPELLEPK